MHWPELAVSSTSSSSVQVSTPRISSPSSSSFMAILPLRLTWTKSDSLLRRTVPRVVANITSSSPQLASSSGSGMMVVMRSPSSSGSRLMQGLAARLRIADRQAPDLFLVDDAARGEEQHRRVRVGHEQPGDEILVLGRHAGAALAAAALRPVERQRHALDVARMGDGDDHVLALDQVLVLHVGAAIGESRCGAACRTRRAPRRARP